MKVQMLVTLAGADFVVDAGDVHDCSEAEALSLIEAGAAIPVDKPKPASRESKTKAEKRG